MSPNKNNWCLSGSPHDRSSGRKWIAPMEMIADSPRSIDGLAETLFPVPGLLPRRNPVRRRLPQVQPSRFGLAGAGCSPLAGPRSLREEGIPGRLSLGSRLLVRDDVLAAVDSVSPVWAGRLFGPELGGGDL